MGVTNRLNPIEVTPDDQPYTLNYDKAVTIRDGKPKGKVNQTSPLPAENLQEGEITLNYDKAVTNTGPSPQSKSAFQFVTNVARNFPGSAKEVAKDFIQPFLDPVGTYNAVKQVAAGYKELIAYDKFISENPNSPKPPITDNMRVAQAVNEYFGDRYGDWTGADKDSWENRGKKVLATIERDPAGFLADVSSVITVAGGAAKLTGNLVSASGKGLKGATNALGREGGIIGGTGEALQSVGEATKQLGTSTMKAGDFVDPLLASAKVLKQVYKPVVMAASGSRDTFKAAEKAYDISKNQDFNATKNLWKSMWDKTSWDDIVGDFNKKVGDYKKEIGTSYNNWKTRIKGEKPMTGEGNFTSIDEISKQLDDLKSELYDTQIITTETKTGVDRISNKDIFTTAQEKRFTPSLNATKEQLDAYDQILDVFKDYKSTPIEDLTADNILSLKQKIQKIRFDGPNTNPFDNYLKDFNKILESDLNKVDPNTRAVMSDYSEMADNLVELKSTIGDAKRPQTQATKLSQLIKDSPRGETGLKNIEDILRDIDSVTIPQITGQVLENPFDIRGLAGTAVATGATGITGIPQIGLLADPTLATIAFGSGLLASSPRALGSVSSTLGLASKYGVDLTNATRGGRFARPIQQTTDEPFPVDLETMDWRIDPDTYNFGL